jgi:hypothetical protein
MGDQEKYSAGATKISHKKYLVGPTKISYGPHKNILWNHELGPIGIKKSFYYFVTKFGSWIK